MKERERDAMLLRLLTTCSLSLLSILPRGSLWTHLEDLHLNSLESESNKCPRLLIRSVCVCAFTCESLYGPACPCVWWIYSSSPPGSEIVGWLGLGVGWYDSAGVEQGQTVQLHLWPFCSFTTWPLTVFRCYMTRIFEPWPFRNTIASHSLYTHR